MPISRPLGDPALAEPTHRLFFALWPDDAMQSALATATRSVVTACDGTPVPIQNFHFTLAFLGAVPASRTRELGELAARAAAYGRGPIDVTLDHIDYWRKSQVLCATSSTEAHAAAALAEHLKHEVTKNGFAPDLKPFRAHVTLARKVRHVTRDRDMPPVHWSFKEFRLIESRTAPSGSLYSTREIFVLDELLR